jgi:hypothetical protein
MKLNLLALALAASTLGSLSAAAQTTVIEDRRAPPVVVEQPTVVVPSGSVDVQRSEPILGGTKNTTIHGDNVNGVGCTTKTVHRDTLLGSSTESRSNCD